jgi:endoglucanase
MALIAIATVGIWCLGIAVALACMPPTEDSGHSTSQAPDCGAAAQQSAPTDEDSASPTDGQSPEPADGQSPEPADGQSPEPADDETTHEADTDCVPESPAPEVGEAAPAPEVAPAPEAPQEKAQGTARGSKLYADGGQAAEWVQANPDDPRAAEIKKEIADQPQAVWIGQGDDAAVQNEVKTTVANAQSTGKVPTLVAYGVPHRDCGGASAGGAGDGATYRSWADSVATGIGDAPAMVIVEPDALAQTDCLDGGQKAERSQLIAYAVETLADKAPAAKTYIDAGNSNWQPAGEMATRLRGAGIDKADGIALNVSNFNPTGTEVDYGKQILGEVGVADKQVVVDTSRNGAGSAGGGQWCDPAGRALGQDPTMDTGDPEVAAYLWVKRPGEADGCAAAAGQFKPELAADLAANTPTDPAAAQDETAPDETVQDKAADGPDQDEGQDRDRAPVAPLPGAPVPSANEPAPAPEDRSTGADSGTGDDSGADTADSPPQGSAGGG